MGYTSQQGQVGFAVQTLKGTPVAATRFARVRSGSLGGTRDLLIPDPEIGGNRDVPQAYLGPIAYAGGYEFYARSEMLAMLARGAFGAVNSSTVAGTSEVQTITITGVPTGGTFRLGYRGQVTAPINFDAANTDIDTALEALSLIGAGNVAVAGAGPFTATFGGALAASDVRPITLAVNSLTGGTAPSVTITATTPGHPVKGTHVFTPSDAQSLPWLSIEERWSVDLESFRYTDAKVGRLRIEADAEGYMMGSCDLTAITQEANFTEQVSPPVDTSPMFLGQQVFIYWNGIQLPAKSFFFELQNNMEDNDFRLGSFTLGDLTEKRRQFSLGATIRPADSALWREATYGGSALTAPRAGRASYGTLLLICRTFEDVQGASTPYTVQLEVPTAAIAPFQITPSGDDVIENDIEFTILRDDPVVPPCTLTIVNDLATAT